MMKNRQKGGKAILIVVPIASMLILIYVCFSFIPIQKAVFPDDLENYENIIVVRYGLGPPTDYMMIGNSSGLFEKSSEDYSAVNLLGNIPPGNKYGNDFSRTHTQYVCFVESNGTQPFLDQGLVETYTVLDWVPLGPINRGGIPSWLLPSGYTCFWDKLF